MLLITLFGRVAVVHWRTASRDSAQRRLDATWKTKRIVRGSIGTYLGEVGLAHEVQCRVAVRGAADRAIGGVVAVATGAVPAVAEESGAEEMAGRRRHRKSWMQRWQTISVVVAVATHQPPRMVETLPVLRMTAT
jgi:hypothetical protein